MAYKVLVRNSEEDEWDAVLDMKLSRTKSVHRLFIDEEAAQYFIDNLTEKSPKDEFMIVEAPELDDEDLVAPV